MNSPLKRQSFWLGKKEDKGHEEVEEITVVCRRTTKKEKWVINEIKIRR